VKKKKCRICRDPFEPIRQLQPTCEKMSCMLESANKNLSKKIKEKKKVARKEKDEFNWSDKKRLKKTTQTTFNKYIRLRDSGKNCVSCQKPHDGAFDCGHFKPRGGYSA